jgi:hypothetical protein
LHMFWYVYVSLYVFTYCVLPVCDMLLSVEHSVLCVRRSVTSVIFFSFFLISYLFFLIKLKMINTILYVFELFTLLILNC